MLLDSVNDYKVPSEIEVRNTIDQAIRKVKLIEGVSNVEYSCDFNEYIFMVSCNFTNVEVLNTIISNFSTKKDAEIIKQKEHFSFNKSENIFIRNYHYNIAREFEKMNMEDRKIFDTATITTIYRFETPIVSSTNPMAKISGSKKAVMLRVGVQDIIKDKKTIKNQIQL